jgi:hypothetical protein
MLTNLKNSKVKIILSILAIFLIFIINISSALHMSNVRKSSGYADEVTIEVVIYDAKEPLVYISSRALSNFRFSYNGIEYRFNVTLLDFKEIVKGKLDANKYDVLMFPGGPIYYVQTTLDDITFFRVWKRNIKKFISAGGGYVGTCGGAAMACQDPVIFWPVVHSIGFVNLHVDVDVLNEGQYFSQYFFSRKGYGIPITISIENSSNPIFSGYYGKKRSIRWWASPGLYYLHDHRNPLLER